VIHFRIMNHNPIVLSHNMKKVKPDGTDTLYYDGNCPICRKEMAHLDTLKEDSLQLLDIHQLPVSDARKQELLSVLHLKTSEGQEIKGYQANLRAWQHTRYAFWARLLSYPPLSWAGQLAYAVWLRYYHWRRSRCVVKNS
jgi:predicted DCC family thiol-disulfide oxidoreductase YuxK